MHAKLFKDGNRRIGAASCCLRNLRCNRRPVQRRATYRAESCPASMPELTPMSSPRWRDTLRRWLTENAADTRERGGPAARLYSASFARVWDGLLEQVTRNPRWELAHQDEELGMLTVCCRTPVIRFVDDVTIWVELDEDGLTRVEVRSASCVGKGDLGVNRRRIVWLLRRLDRHVGPEARLRERRGRRRQKAAPAVGPTASGSPTERR